MNKLMNKIKNRTGAVTIEATIALTAYLFMFIMIYSIISVCRFQASMQVAINSVAKEISQYSYLYSITGVHDAMNNLQKNAEGTKSDTNALVGDVADVFSGIQSIGGTAAEIDGVEGIMDRWDTLKGQLESTGDSATAAKKKVADMAKDPTALLFGMAKLFASEGYELAKSAVAEAASHALVQKYLIRNEDDTAEAYCKALGVVPGSYFGTESYFNGIDFSRSTLFPYGSDEITIVANYEIHLLQLLPIDVTFHITQTAVTKGWLQGEVDGTGEKYTPENLEEKIKQERGDSIWNAATPSEREKLIRSMGITDLKDEGYYSVSGQTYIHAYDPKTNTFAMVRSYNPLAGVDSVADVNKDEIKEYLLKLQGQMESTTDNITTIKIKKTDANGNLVTSEVNCSGACEQRVIVVIPEDPELLDVFLEAAREVKQTVDFEFLPSYGTVFKDGSSETQTEGDTTE